MMSTEEVHEQVLVETSAKNRMPGIGNTTKQEREKDGLPILHLIIKI